MTEIEKFARAHGIWIAPDAVEAKPIPAPPPAEGHASAPLREKLSLPQTKPGHPAPSAARHRK